MTEHHKHLRVYEAASIQPRGYHRRPKCLQDGAGFMQVTQGLGTVANANMSVHAGSRREPAAARKREVSRANRRLAKWMSARAAHHRIPVTSEHL